jgi:nucleotide-binding universal stress UspA family protein
MTIVVGVDGSAVSQQALTWAIAEGKLRHESVRAVYAWHDILLAAAGRRPLGAVGDDGLAREVDEPQKDAERRLAAAVAELSGAGGVEQRTVQGHPIEVLVEQSRDADLLVVGSRGHGALGSVLLGSVSRGCAHHAECPVVVIRDPEGTAARARAVARARVSDLDEVLAREIAENARTWEALERLGVHEGAQLTLEFAYESGGPSSDRVLAEYLRDENGYEVEVDPEGITGWTPPLPVSPAALDQWVTRMVLAGREHGGCAFGGWTATISAVRGWQAVTDVATSSARS